MLGFPFKVSAAHNALAICSPVRPLNRISDIVCEDMPKYAAMLRQPRSESEAALSRFICDVCQLTETIDIAKVFQSPQADLALLDLKMLHAFISMAQKSAERGDSTNYISQVSQARAFLADKIGDANRIGQYAPVTHLTYRDIVLSNPEHDMRAFCIQDERETEYGFYRGHTIIEDKLSSIINLLKPTLHAGSDEFIEKSLLQAKDIMREVAVMMRSFMTSMNKEHFLAFRPFFDTNPYTKEKGPSGAFSAKIPHIDILLWGSDTPTDIYTYLNENHLYFPPEDYKDIQNTISLGVSVINVISNPEMSPGVHEAFQEVAKTIVAFRRFHFGATRKHLGSVYEGSAESDNSAAFLERRVNEFDSLARRPRGAFE